MLDNTNYFNKCEPIDGIQYMNNYPFYVTRTIGI
jgi:hypothetical protein